MFYESRLDTHDTHTRPMTRTRAVGWSRVARHRAPSRDAGRRRPGRRPPPPVRAVSSFFVSFARASPDVSETSRAVRPSRHPSIHPSRTAPRKSPERAPPVEVESTFSPDRMARTDGTPPTDGRDGRTRRNRTRRTKSNERTKERARKPRAARADAIPRFPSRPPSFARSRSFASSRGANQNHKPIVFERIMGFGTTKTPGKNQSSSLCR